LPLIESLRGTNRAEAWHRVLYGLMRNFKNVGAQLSDCILTEARHRYNHRNAERKRLGFPKIGHYDTWLIDKLQILHEQNHGVRLYSGWSNTCDFIKTPELTTMVPLHTAELGAVVESLHLEPSRIKLTRDLRYLAEKMKLTVPFLPLHSVAEKRLFSMLLLEVGNTEVPDFKTLALEFTKRADGVTIFPTLPVYLRLYHTKWKHSKRIEDAMQRLGDPLAELRRRLQESADQLAWAQLPVAASPPEPPSPPPRAAAPPADAPATSPFANAPAAAAPATAPAAAAPTGDAPMDNPPADNAPADDAATPSATAPAFPFTFAQTLVAPNSTLPMAPAYLHAQASDYVATVAGILLQPQGDGSLRPAKPPRAKRMCPRCVQFGDGSKCSSGSGGARYCSLFNEDGSPAERKRKQARSSRPCSRCVAAGMILQAATCSGRNWHESKCGHLDANGDPRVAE